MECALVWMGYLRIQYTNYFEYTLSKQEHHTVPNYMGLPENIDDFRAHYRETRHLFDILLEMTVLFS